MKNRIRVLREALGLSQQELADKAGLTAPTISRLERDTREMSRTTRRALAHALEVTENGLFVDNDPLAPSPSSGGFTEANGSHALIVLCRTVEQLIEVEEFDLAATTATKLADRCRAREATKASDGSDKSR